MLLSDFIHINPKITLDKGATYAFIEMEDINPGSRYVEASKTKPFKGGGSRFQSRDTIFARITPCLENGKIAQVKGSHGQSYFGSTEFYVFRAKENVSDDGFVFYLAYSDIIRKPAEKSMYGASGRQRAALDAIKTIQIPAMSLDNQRKISTILSAYDDLIENNIKRIHILDEMAQRVYQEWIVEFHFDGYKTAQFSKDKMPCGWEFKLLSEVFDFQNGFAFYKEGYSKTGRLVVDLGNVTVDRQFVITGKDKFVDEDLYQRKNKFHLNQFDVVVAMTDMTQTMGILGKVAIIDKSNCYILNQRVGRLRSKMDIVDYSFIYASLSDNRFVDAMRRVSKGAVQKYFNTSDILSYKILVPTENVIKEFTAVYKPLIEERMFLQEKNAVLKETRDYLLPKLISKEVDVSKVNFT